MPDPTLIPPSPDEQLAALRRDHPRWTIRWVGLDWLADLQIPAGYVVVVLPSAGALANRMTELEEQFPPGGKPENGKPPARTEVVKEAMKDIDQ